MLWICLFKSAKAAWTLPRFRQNVKKKKRLNNEDSWRSQQKLTERHLLGLSVRMHVQLLWVAWHQPPPNTIKFHPELAKMVRPFMALEKMGWITKARSHTLFLEAFREHSGSGLYQLLDQLSIASSFGKLRQNILKNPAPYQSECLKQPHPRAMRP